MEAKGRAGGGVAVGDLELLTDNGHLLRLLLGLPLLQIACVGKVGLREGGHKVAVQRTQRLLLFFDLLQAALKLAFLIGRGRPGHDLTHLLRLLLELRDPPQPQPDELPRRRLRRRHWHYSVGVARPRRHARRRILWHAPHVHVAGPGLLRHVVSPGCVEIGATPTAAQPTMCCSQTMSKRATWHDYPEEWVPTNSSTPLFGLLIMVFMYRAGPARRDGAGAVSQEQSAMAKNPTGHTAREAHRRAFGTLACVRCLRRRNESARAPCARSCNKGGSAATYGGRATQP